MKNIWLLIIFLFTHSAYAAECKSLVPKLNKSASYIEDMSDTTLFISYIAKLFEIKVLQEHNLLRMLSGLEDRNRVTYPFASEEIALDVGLLIHNLRIRKFIDESEFNIGEVKAWLLTALDRQEKEKAERTKLEEETKDTFLPIKFYPIPQAGIEMMSTQVTQMHWAMVMAGTSSWFKGGEDSHIEVVGSSGVPVEVDHPAESMSWWSAIKFANELSMKHGLKPVYILENAPVEGSAAEGQLRATIDGWIVKIDAPNGDIRLAEGYRLPTFEEREFLIVQMNLENPNIAIHDHAWLRENSDGRTHPVAELKPLMINGFPFYDLIGNVYEWGHEKQYSTQQGIDRADLFGASFDTPASRVNPNRIVESKEGVAVTQRYNGVRLVRSLNVESKE